MPDSDVRNRNATARDPRLAAAHARGDRDVLIHRFRSHPGTSICVLAKRRRSGSADTRGHSPIW